MSDIVSATQPSPSTSFDPKVVQEVATELEASFITEMLKSSGLGQPRKGFGGGPGEDQFATFLVRAQAEEMAKTGGFGLAESIFQSLMARQK